MAWFSIKRYAVIPLKEEPPLTDFGKLTDLGKRTYAALTAQAEEYRRRFIDDLTYLCPPFGCSNVRICPEFVKQIRQLQPLCGNRKANLTTFINNLLRQHFDECKDAIVKLSKEYAKSLE